MPARHTRTFGSIRTRLPWTPTIAPQVPPTKRCTSVHFQKKTAVSNARRRWREGRPRLRRDMLVVSGYRAVVLCVGLFVCTGTLPKCSAREPTDWRNEKGMESRRLFAMGARGEESVVRYIMEQRYIGTGISSSFRVIFPSHNWAGLLTKTLAHVHRSLLYPSPTSE